MNKDDDGRRLRSAFGRYRQPVSQPDEGNDTKILIRDLLFFAALLLSPLVFGFPPTLSWLTAQKFGPLQLSPPFPYSLLDGLYCMQQKAFHPGGAHYTAERHEGRGTLWPAENV